jgi:hypothetical protein
MRQGRFFSAISIPLSLGFIAACYILTSLATYSLAAPAEAVRSMVKWEYCTIVVNEAGGCTWTTVGNEVDGFGWSGLAEKMKAPVKGENPSENRCRVVVFDFLGAQGWEHASQSVVVETEKGGKTTKVTETIVFKRPR